MPAGTKHKEVLHQILSGTILPLFQEIQQQCKQLDGLFFQTENRIRFGRKGMADSSLRTKNWNDLEKNWLDGEGFSRQFESGLEQFNYEYNWIDFEKTGVPFNVKCVLEIEFKDLEYSVAFNGIFEEIKLIKNYNEKLSKEEIAEISKLFVKEVQEEIANKTKK